MYPIKIRADHENGPDLRFTEAVQLAASRGRQARICVTAVYPQDAPDGHKAGQAVFGMDAEITVRRTQWEDSDATVSISGIASHSPEIGVLRAQCYLLASQIAMAANAAAAVNADAA